MAFSANESVGVSDLSSLKAFFFKGEESLDSETKALVDSKIREVSACERSDYVYI